MKYNNFLEWKPVYSALYPMLTQRRELRAQAREEKFNTRITLIAFVILSAIVLVGFIQTKYF